MPTAPRSSSIESSSSLVVLLAALAAMNALSVEIILPAIVPIAEDMHVSEENAAMLIGAYFLAYAVGQVVWGLLSDAFGRRPMLLLGLFSYVLASAGAAMAGDFQTLLIVRIIQGALGAAPIIANAIVRDISSGQQAARTQAVLAATVSIAPLIAPAIGSGLLVLSGWRIIFLFLTIFSTILLVIAVLRLPETLAERKPSRLHPSFTARRVRELAASAQFRTGALVMSLSFAGFAALLSMGSVVAENAFGISPEAFGSVYAVIALATLAGVLTARALLKTLPLFQVGRIAIATLALGVIAHAILLAFDPPFALFWALIGLYLLGFGMVYPTFTSIALEAAGSTMGFAASIVGAMNMTFGFVSSFIAASLYDGSFRVISLSMLGFGSLAIVSYLTYRRERQS